MEEIDNAIGILNLSAILKQHMDETDAQIAALEEKMKAVADEFKAIQEFMITVRDKVNEQK